MAVPPLQQCCYRRELRRSKIAAKIHNDVLIELAFLLQFLKSLKIRLERVGITESRYAIGRSFVEYFHERNLAQLSIERWHGFQERI